MVFVKWPLQNASLLTLHYTGSKCIYFTGVQTKYIEEVDFLNLFLINDEVEKSK